MVSQAHGEPNRANRPTDSQKKKKKKKKKKNQHRIKHQTYPSYPRSRRCRKNQSPIHDTVYTIQSKSKTNQKKYCVYQKKNPIQSLCTKTAKPNQKTPILTPRSPQLAPHRHRRSSRLVVVAVARPSSQIADRRQQITIAVASRRSLCSVLADRRSQSQSSSPQLGASRSQIPPDRRTLPELQLPQGISNFSLFFSLSFSVSLSFSH